MNNYEGINNMNIYKGYKYFKGNSSEINEYMNTYTDSWYINEYLIIYNTDDDTERELRWDGDKFVPLRLPPSKFIKARNALQRCALDMLNNKDITICCVLGTYGSGKTRLCLSSALRAVTQLGFQSSILGVRQPIGEGAEIGFLPGDFASKTDLFFMPLEQQLDGGSYELEALKQRGVLETNIPYYMKGTTYNNTILVCDEAEDMDFKQLKLVGTRVGQNSRIFFCGDHEQSVVDSSDSNALIKMCEFMKGNPLFAVIYLEEDVRSETSKLFAGMKF